MKNSWSLSLMRNFQQYQVFIGLLLVSISIIIVGIIIGNKIQEGSNLIRSGITYSSEILR